jgi:hypothetical protein
MNARYMGSETGRFISEDTYRGDGEEYWHLYAYCEGDPVNYTDKSGHGVILNDTIRKIRKNAIARGKKEKISQIRALRSYFWIPLAKSVQKQVPVAAGFLIHSAQSNPSNMYINSSRNVQAYNLFKNDWAIRNKIGAPFVEKVRQQGLRRVWTINNYTGKRGQGLLTKPNSVDLYLAIGRFTITTISGTAYPTGKVNASGKAYDYYDFDQVNAVYDYISGGLLNYAATDMKNGVLSKYHTYINFSISGKLKRVYAGWQFL